MSDVITLANEIAKYKEQIRKAIEAHGVVCDETTPLAQYSIKIGEIKNTAEGGLVFYGSETDPTLTHETTEYTMPSIDYTTVCAGAFNGSKNINTINFMNVRYLDNNNFTDNKELVSVIGEHVEYVGNNNFSNCDKLATISLPAAKYIKDYAIYNCKYLTNIDLPSAEYIGACALRGCGNSKVSEVIDTRITINIPKVKHICHQGLYNINGLYELDIPECTNIDYYGLANNEKLTTINCPAIENLSYGALQGDSALTELLTSKCKHVGKFALAATKIQTLQVSDDCVFDDYATYNQETSSNPSSGYGLSSLKVVTGCPKYISRYAFAQCTSLHTIDLSKCTYIGVQAFGYCSSLQNVDVSACIKFDTNCFNSSALIQIYADECTTVNDSAFAGCADLRIVSLPKCTYIGGSVFNSCSRLRKVWVSKNCTTIGSSAFNTTGSCRLYTDAESKPSGWSSVPTNVTYGATYEDFLNA